MDGLLAKLEEMTAYAETLEKDMMPLRDALNRIAFANKADTSYEFLQRIAKHALEAWLRRADSEMKTVRHVVNRCCENAECSNEQVTHILTVPEEDSAFAVANTLNIQSVDKCPVCGRKLIFFSKPEQGEDFMNTKQSPEHEEEYKNTLVDIAKMVRLDAWAFNELAAKVYHKVLEVLNLEDEDIAKL